MPDPTPDLATLRAAAVAAYDAAIDADAARAVAWAAGAAAWDAERRWQTTRLWEYLEGTRT